MKMPDKVGNPLLHTLEHGSREQQKRGHQLTESVVPSAAQKAWTVFMEISRLFAYYCSRAYPTLTVVPTIEADSQDGALMGKNKSWVPPITEPTAKAEEERSDLVDTDL